MRRLTAVITLVICLLVAALITSRAPEDPTIQPVSARIGEPVSVEAGLSVTVTDIAVTHHLSGVLERDTEQVYLVVGVDVQVTGPASPILSLTVVSGHSTFVPGSNDLDLPLGGNPGYVSHVMVPVLMEQADLSRSQVEITVTGAMIRGFNRVARIDLGLTPERVDELLIGANGPIDVQPASVEVIQ
ncbi:MAG: hypothetical protein LBV06_09705 [Propionibacteriaceae bacterium]|jgi:hypothetical protein|nr:hypothetical protein [Propionibacteriaceae bacterium]